MKKKYSAKKSVCLLLICCLAITGCGQKKQKSPSSDSKKAISKEVDTKKKKEKTKIVLNLGELKALVFNTKDISKLSFTSADENIARVNEKGRVLGMKGGSTTITGTDGTRKVTYQIKVRKKGMVYPTFTMMKGEHLDLQFSKKGIKVTEWISSNEKVASVDKTSGKVQAISEGNAMITGKSGKHNYVCYLKVEPIVKDLIYLTFDDGPNRYSTPKILDILKEKGVKATFFELKPARADYDLTERVVREGHSLAMHGYQHKYDIIYKSVDIYHENLTKLQERLFRKVGVWCTVSRFPGGGSNMSSSYNPGIMTKITSQIHDWGFHYFDWNADSEDAGGAKDANAVYKNVTSHLEKGRGNVVLMHDFYKNDKTIQALPRIIDYGKKHGFTFRRITASTEEVHQKVNN